MHPSKERRLQLDVALAPDHQGIRVRGKRQKVFAEPQQHVALVERGELLIHEKSVAGRQVEQAEQMRSPAGGRTGGRRLRGRCHRRQLQAPLELVQVAPGFASFG